jgi:WD40 repeat protein
MPITIRCPCGKALKARDESAGKKVKCPGCGQAVLVPGPAEAVTAQPPPRRDPVPAPPPRQGRDAGAAPPGPQRQSVAVRVLSALAGVLVLAVLGFVIWLVWLRHGASGDWREFVSREGAFKVLLPGEPTASTRTLGTPDGPTTQYVFTVQFPKYREAYIVSYADFPARRLELGPERLIDAELRQLHDRATMATRKEFTGAREVSPGMYAGQVTVVGTKDGTVRAKAIMVKQRLFTLVVQSRFDHESESLAQKLYDSFEIVGEVPDRTKVVAKGPEPPGPQAPEPVGPKKAPEPAGPKASAGPFQGHTEVIDYAAFSARGDRLATVARDGTLRVWEYPSGKELAMAYLRDEYRNPNSVAFAPDGKTLAVGLGGPVEKLLLWDLAARRETARTQVPGSGLYLAYSADGKNLILVTGTRSYRLDPAAPGNIQELGYNGPAALSADGSRLFVGHGEEIGVYDLGPGGPGKRPRVPAGGRVLSLAVSGDSRLLFVGMGGRVQLWDAVRVAPLGKEIPTVDAHGLALWPGVNLLGVRGPTGYAAYALPEGKELARENVPGLERVLLAPDGKVVLIHGPQITLRDPRAGKKQ